MTAAPCIRGVVKARLLALWGTVREAVTLRRREKRWTTYALRLFCLFLLLGVLPAAKLVQLGPVGFVLAALKVVVAATLVAGALGAVFAVEEWLKRRGRAA